MKPLLHKTKMMDPQKHHTWTEHFEGVERTLFVQLCDENSNDSGGGGGNNIPNNNMQSHSLEEGFDLRQSISISQWCKLLDSAKVEVQ